MTYTNGRTVIRARSRWWLSTPAQLLSVVLVAQFASGCLSNEYRIPKDELWRLAQTPQESRGQRVRVVQALGDRRDEAVNPDAYATEYSAAPLREDVPSGHGGVWVGPHIHLGGGGHRLRSNFGQARPRGFGPQSGSLRGPPPRAGLGGCCGGGIGGGGGGGGGGKDTLVVVAVALVAAAFVATVGLAASEGARFDGHAALAPHQFVYLKDRNGQVTETSIAMLSPDQVTTAVEATVMDDEGAGLRRLGRVPLNRKGGTFRLDAGTTAFDYDGADVMGPMAHIQAGLFLTRHVGLLADLGLSGGTTCCGGTVVRHSLALELDVLPLRVGPVHAGVFAKGGMALAGTPSSRQSGPMFGGGALIEIELTSRLALLFRAGANGAQLDGGAWSSATTLTGGLAIY